MGFLKKGKKGYFKGSNAPAGLSLRKYSLQKDFNRPGF
jgi:hypothetical protein